MEMFQDKLSMLIQGLMVILCRLACLLNFSQDQLKRTSENN